MLYRFLPTDKVCIEHLVPNRVRMMPPILYFLPDYYSHVTISPLGRVELRATKAVLGSFKLATIDASFGSMQQVGLIHVRCLHAQTLRFKSVGRPLIRETPSI